MMDSNSVYKDIWARTDGQFLVGVVGPVRTGKSTFIRRFMELFALPAMDEALQAEVRDQLPLSGAGRMITTVEPKFVPKEAVEIRLSGDIPVRVRLIDCVGYLVPGAVGDAQEEKERMVRTPWFEEEIPFSRAAEIGTGKVIREHSSIGLVVTADGSFGEIPRASFTESERRCIAEMKKQGKPFLILVNSRKPFGEEAEALTAALEEEYGAAAMSVNCEQLRREDILRILEKILYEFPVRQMEFYIPKWVEILPADHPVKARLLEQMRQIAGKVNCIRDAKEETLRMDAEEVRNVTAEEIRLADGVIRVRIEMKDACYYDVMSEMTGVEIRSEYQLIRTLRELAAQREEYSRVGQAMASVRGGGYGVVTPRRGEIRLEEPRLIRQGNKFGVKICSKSPSIHMIRANIETEIAPIVGSEKQAQDLIAFIQENSRTNDGIWETNIFGKSVEQLIEDGIRAKIMQIGEESQAKLQDTMQKIVNDSRGGMVCIII